MNDAKRHIEPHRPVFVLVGCKLDLVIGKKSYFHKFKTDFVWIITIYLFYSYQLFMIIIFYLHLCYYVQFKFITLKITL